MKDIVTHKTLALALGCSLFVPQLWAKQSCIGDEIGMRAPTPYLTTPLDYESKIEACLLFSL